MCWNTLKIYFDSSLKIYQSVLFLYAGALHLTKYSCVIFAIMYIERKIKIFKTHKIIYFKIQILWYFEKVLRK